MKSRSWVALAVVLAVSLIAGRAGAQLRGPQPVVPTVISGADIGFQVESWNGDVPTGRWVVRGATGQWVEPKASTSVRPLTAK
jgi:hypothetical protein